MKGRMFICVALVFILVYFFPTKNIPKIVWCHWDSSDLPDFHRANLEKRREILYGWDVRFVTTESVLKETKPPSSFYLLKKEHQSDWIRMYLLERYGGVWMDMGIVLRESIDSLWQEATSKNADYLGFYIDKLNVNPAYPVIENWFIMAPPSSSVIILWKAEYETAMEMGFPSYKELLQKEGIDLQRCFNPENKEDVYLTQHACMQRLLQTNVLSGTIMLYRAEDSMFSIHDRCKWEKTCITESFEKDSLPKWIKLRGGDRKYLSKAAEKRLLQ